MNVEAAFKSVTTERGLTFLLGAEGCLEAQNCGWVRDATDAEIDAFKSAAGLTDEQIKEYNPDKTGRPYWWKTLTDDAPEWAKAAVKRFFRMRYLSDHQS